MARGTNVAICIHCGLHWLVDLCWSADDLMPSMCAWCRATGHQGFRMRCPVCRADRARQASQAERQQAQSRYLDQIAEPGE